jgi:hypothetical protein
MSLRTYAQIVSLSLLVSSTAFAQPVTGLPPFGSFSGGPFDTINNANLNAHFEIPIINKAGRGQALTYSLTYDSSIWMPVYAGGTTTWTPTPLSTWGWKAATNAPQAVIGRVTSTAVQNGCPTNPPLNNQWYYWITYSNFTYIDTSETPHPVPGLTISDFQSGHGCGGGPPSSMTSATTDGSGYQVTAGTYAGAGYAYLVSAVKTNGTILGLVSGPTGPADSQDSNGNQITSSFSSGVITVTDTLGSSALSVSTGNPMTLSYTNPQGGTSSFVVHYTSKTVQTAFGCSGIAEYGPTSINLVTSIDLPDKSAHPTEAYTIIYEQTPGNPSNTTGRIASITLPTGGTISYQYLGGSNGITCSDGSAATLKRQTPDSAPSSWWTYAHTPGSTTITDPAGNQTALTFQGIYEVQRTASLGTSVGLTVSTCYNTPCPTAAIDDLQQRAIQDREHVRLNGIGLAAGSGRIRLWRLCAEPAVRDGGNPIQDHFVRDSRERDCGPAIGGHRVRFDPHQGGPGELHVRPGNPGRHVGYSTARIGFGRARQPDRNLAPGGRIHDPQSRLHILRHRQRADRHGREQCRDDVLLRLGNGLHVVRKLLRDRHVPAAVALDVGELELQRRRAGLGHGR